MSAVLQALPWWIALPLKLGGLALCVIVALAVLCASLNLAQRAWYASGRLIELIEQLLVRVVMNACAWVAIIVMGVGYVVLSLFQLVWAHTGTPVLDALALKAEAARQRQQLREHWRQEFRDQFPTFEEFLDAFENGVRREPQGEQGHAGQRDRRHEQRQDQRRERPKGQQEQRGAPDPADVQRQAFVNACRLLGLPQDGNFTLQQLKARHRTLISRAHPDKAGDAQRAAALNVARDFIKQRKGWT